jgi:uncharacterized small protein (DUF1192 family)
VDEKDLSLLDSDLSPLRADSLTERIARLRREIDKGSTTYSRMELDRLQQALCEYEQMLERLNSP